MNIQITQIQVEAEKAASNLAELLDQKKCRIVFAESCTAGLISALLAQTPGISQWHCGSAVVYQIETKEQWLEIDSQLLIDPGPVSEIIAQKMSEGVLKKTAQAKISASITGHLGPGAPEDQDGLVYIGISFRQENSNSFETKVFPYWLAKKNELKTSIETEEELRVYRQKQAALVVFQALIKTLDHT